MTIKTIECMPGMRISSACENAVKMAIDENCIVEFDFNGINLTATPETDPAKLAQSYMDESERRHREYLASPECKARQEEAERKERDDGGVFGETPEEMTANANLIAAAPELLDCLLHLAKRDWYQDGKSGLVTCTLDADKVRNAIRKAFGQNAKAIGPQKSQP